MVVEIVPLIKVQAAAELAFLANHSMSRGVSDSVAQDV